MADNSQPTPPQSPNRETAAPEATRRQFFNKALAFTTALAAAEQLAAQQTTPTCPAQPAGGVTGTPLSGAPLPTIGEIARGGDAVLRATVAVQDENKWMWMAKANQSDAGGYAVPYCPDNSQRMRFFTGAVTGKPTAWPTGKGVPTAGPTLRARVGDLVNITLLNQVDTKNFPDTLDLAEQGKSEGCDVSSTLNGPIGNQTRQQVYPLQDREPDCLHGSSSANLHFHGFHVTPGTVGDNVLVQVRPSPRDPRTNAPIVTGNSVKTAFDQVFASVGSGHGPHTWSGLPKAFTDQQEALLKAYDQKVPIAKLWPADQKAIATGQWPQYYVGAYPNAFRITEYNKPIVPGGPPAVMGQAPGTHWYHSHKHGSTALNSFNGMSGVFIVEGKYDDDLRKFYAGKGPNKSGLKEQVMIVQQFAAALNLMTAQGSPTGNQGTTKEPLPFVNSVRQPVVKMQPGETQLWRMLNACAQVQIGVTGFGPATGSAVAQQPLAYKQIAQDGVQFHPTNFNLPSNNSPQLRMSAGNRVDLLVQAPSTPGIYSLNVNLYPFPAQGATPPPGPTTTLLTVQVAGDAIPAMGYPDAAGYPEFPQFLADIDPSTIHIRREIVFNSAQGIAHGNGPNGNLPPQHTINGKGFENNVIDQTMILGESEEWTLRNSTTTVQHPFHIHINPFQIVEMFDPSLDPNIDPANPYASKQCFATLQAPYRWHDTIGIPSAIKKNNVTIPGHVKIRHRFDDFLGMYVIHCHILAHEDRGMMQLVQVISNKTTNEHYH
jgi:FtsP/CotA-like multicopper oxidase with cupredoxin domain